MADVAGVCDTTGRVLGLIPHPERHLDPTHHPRWTRGEAGRGWATDCECSVMQCSIFRDLTFQVQRPSPLTTG